MENIQDIVGKEEMEKMESAFAEKGFAHEEFISQMTRIGNIATQSAFLELLKGKPPAEKFSSEEDISQYLRANYSEEEVQTTLIRETDRVLAGYLKEIGITDFSKK